MNHYNQLPKNYGNIKRNDYGFMETFYNNKKKEEKKMSKSIRELRNEVMALHCKWWNTWTNNDEDTAAKKAMYDEVYAMDEKQLRTHLKTKGRMRYDARRKKCILIY